MLVACGWQIKQAQAKYAQDDPKNKAFMFLHCWLEIRNSEKFISLHNAMKQARCGSKRATSSDAEDPAPDSEVPPAKRPMGRKQAKKNSKLGSTSDNDYLEVWSSFVQMKEEEQKQRKERWKEDKELEERRVEIEERRLQWEQEQRIMFCDVSTMDSSQREYVLALREELARAKVASVRVARSCASEQGSAS